MNSRNGSFITPFKNITVIYRKTFSDILVSWHFTVQQSEISGVITCWMVVMLVKNSGYYITTAGRTSTVYTGIRRPKCEELFARIHHSHQWKTKSKQDMNCVWKRISNNLIWEKSRLLPFYWDRTSVLPFIRFWSEYINMKGGGVAGYFSLELPCNYLRGWNILQRVIYRTFFILRILNPNPSEL